MAVSPFDLDQPVQSQSARKARNRFAELVALDDDQINLAEATLLIATEEYSRLNIQDYLDKLDRFGDLARERAEGASDASHVISAINSTLFDELGFHGNRDGYFDPRNSFLNQVIDRSLQSARMRPAIFLLTRLMEADCWTLAVARKCFRK